MEDEFFKKQQEFISDYHIRWLEFQIKIVLKPRPRYLPEFIWHRIVGRLIYVEMLPPKFHGVG